MKITIDSLKNIKFIIGLILSLCAAAVWGIDRLHRPYLLKTELLAIFHARDINRHQVEIAKLEIKKSLAVSKHGQNEYDSLIGIEKLQILKLKGVN